MTKAKNSNTKSTKSTKTTKKVVKKNAMQDIQIESATGELRKLSTLLIMIVGIICIFYIITVIVTKKNQTLQYQASDEISQISYTDILASDILEKNGTYYVLVEDNEDAYIDLYETYVSSYVALDEHLPVYYVDLNDALNQKYKAEQNNFSVDSLQFKGTTLLKISNNTIESFYEDSISINEHLKLLVTE